MMTMPTIQSQLPIVFQSGFRLTEFDGVCHCGTEIPHVDLHGHFTEPISDVAVLEALGACPKCKLWIPFRVRFRGDGAMEWVKNGEWVRTQPERSKRVSRKVREWLAGSIAFYLIFMPMIVAVIFMVCSTSRHLKP